MNDSMNPLANSHELRRRKEQKGTDAEEKQRKSREKRENREGFAFVTRFPFAHKSFHSVS
jgi:hypothetical protein